MHAPQGSNHGQDLLASSASAPCGSGSSMIAALRTNIQANKELQLLGWLACP